MVWQQVQQNFGIVLDAELEELSDFHDETLLLKQQQVEHAERGLVVC
jgi:hypothetical protein